MAPSFGGLFVGASVSVVGGTVVADCSVVGPPPAGFNVVVILAVVVGGVVVVSANANTVSGSATPTVPENL